MTKSEVAELLEQAPKLVASAIERGWIQPGPHYLGQHVPYEPYVPKGRGAVPPERVEAVESEIEHDLLRAKISSLKLDHAIEGDVSMRQRIDSLRKRIQEKPRAGSYEVRKVSESRVQIVCTREPGHLGVRIAYS